MKRGGSGGDEEGWGIGVVQAVKKGLKEREDALLTHYSISQDLEKKKSTIAALQEQEQKTFGGDKSKTRKVSAVA